MAPVLVFAPGFCLSIIPRKDEGNLSNLKDERNLSLPELPLVLVFTMTKLEQALNMPGQVQPLGYIPSSLFILRQALS